MATSRFLGPPAVAALMGGVRTSGHQVSTPANRNRWVIAVEVIEPAQETNAFQLGQKLRPACLASMSRRQTPDPGATTLKTH